MSSSASFVHTLPLKANPEQIKTLDIKLDAARMLYNACLGEGLRRLQLVRESKNWQKAREIKDKTLFRKAQKQYKLSDYDLQAFAIQTRKSCHLKDHLDANTAQKIATKVYSAVAQYMYNKRGRPRFKPKGRLKSVEGKSNAAGIRFKGGMVNWGKLKLAPIFDKKDKHAVEAHALSKSTKYVRLLKKEIQGSTRYFAQLIQSGTPKVKSKNTTQAGSVGLDIGPSTIAIVSDTEAKLQAFCPEIENFESEIKQAQKQLDRSKRATNPANFNEDKTIKRGAKKWTFSNQYKKIRSKLSELNRRLSEGRARSHNKLVNDVFRLGDSVKLERLSYRSFQKNFGKSVAKRAPGSFVEKLKSKAERAGFEVIEFSTYKTKLSQCCHSCGSYAKKPLSQRWHLCACGIGPVQRDLYSAYLAKYVESDTLNMHQSQKDWSGAQPLLEQAMLGLKESSNGRDFVPASFGLGNLNQRQRASSVKDGSMFVDAKDVVQQGQPMLESLGETDNIAIKTPRIYP